jgi:hypothetical protein
MKTPCGPPRKLTDRQIDQVLNWHQEANEFRHAHGTARDLARVLGVSMHAVRGCFEIRVRGSANKGRTRWSHPPGRPRHLNPAQIAFAIAWRNAGRQFRARHGTVASLARTLGVGGSTIHDCIRRKGRYAQRGHVVVCQEAGRASLPKSDDVVRAALLRAWSRSAAKL